MIVAQQIHMLLNYNYILIILFSLGEELWLTSKETEVGDCKHIFQQKEFFAFLILHT